MYRKPHVNQLAFEDFVLPFGGKLRSDNRWVILAKHSPWAEVETAYAQQFSQEDNGLAREVLTPCTGCPHLNRAARRDRS